MTFMGWTRWRRAAFGILSAGLICLTGCTARSEQPAGKAVVILVDRSLSAGADRELYARAMDRVQQDLQPGDRIIGAWITESSAEDFRDYLDSELPAPFPPMGALDIASKYKRDKEQWDVQMAESLAHVRRGIATLMEQPSRSGKSKIFESLRVVGQILASERRPRKIVILLSDMVEDSETADFEHARLDKAFVEKMVAQQRENGTLPNLQGVTVFAAGVRGSPVDRAAAIEQFWRGYFEAAGANVGPGAISRALPSFGN